MTVAIEFEPVDSDTLNLSEELETGEAGTGQLKQLEITNTGDEQIAEITVGLGGPGAGFVQLAVDKKNQPGVFAARGEEIVMKNLNLRKGSKVRFWSRAAFSEDDAHLNLPFDYGFEVKTP